MGLEILQEFREKLDDIMLKAMHCSVLLYGYDNSTGRFIKWYAEYYHNIKPDYIISTIMQRGMAHDREIFTPELIDYDYKDVKNCIIWMAEPLTPKLKEKFERLGYKKDETYFDFFEMIYGNDLVWEEFGEQNVYLKRKQGKRDIQFLEWLEWKFDCNFLTMISKDTYKVSPPGAGYGCSTQKEVFPILDHCHCIPKIEDKIFDLGCGKGGAIVSFLDYGFDKVGGIEFDKDLFEICQDNMCKLGIQDKVNLYCGDASGLTNELDEYNWFFFYSSLGQEITKKIVDNLKESILRKKRRIHILLASGIPVGTEVMENSGYLKLVNQFTHDRLRRVVKIYESKVR